MDLSSCFHLCRLHFGRCHQEFFSRTRDCDREKWTVLFPSLFIPPSLKSEREIGDSCSTDIRKTLPSLPCKGIPLLFSTRISRRTVKVLKALPTLPYPSPLQEITHLPHLYLCFCFIVRSNPYLLIIGQQVNITGTMHFWGLTIDTVSTICLVLAVGLSVDYASHVGHTFMIIPGSRTGECSCLSVSI